MGYQSTAAAPDNITICGAPDTVTVVVSLDGTATEPRTNLTATLKLFTGVRMNALITSGTTSGVSVASGQGTGVVTFNLPNIVPGVQPQVTIRMSISGSCELSDTLRLNNQALVQDLWTFNYNLGSQTGLTESDFNSEYRDAVKIPFFTMGLMSNSIGAVVGNSFERQVIVSNSGLSGYVSSMVYTNLQGPGIWVRGMKINGIDASMQKVRQANGDTLISVTITPAMIAANTVGNSIGNGNNLFEKDEQLRIVEDAVLVSCSRSRFSTHTASWGCFSKTCNSVSRTDNVFVGEGNVNIVFTNTGLPVARKNVGYCQQGIYPTRFTNNGIAIDPGTANMYNVALGIGIGDQFRLQQGAFKIVKFVVAGLTFNSPDSSLLFLNNHPMLVNDPDGTGGLADLDNDGYFDDLPPGASIDLIAYVDLDCNQTTQIEPLKKSNNNLEMVLNARIDHTNFCNERVSFARNRFQTSTHTLDVFENCSDPDVAVGGGVFIIEHFQRRNVFNFERNCNGQEIFIVKAVLPTGVTVVLNQTTFLRSTTNMPLLSNTMSGDTLILQFAGNVSQFLNGDYFLKLALQAGCTAQLGLSQINLQVEHFCPPCNCRHIWYNDNITGPYIHEKPSLCPGNLAVCPSGLRTTAFEVNRTTLGYTDANYTTKISASAANNKVAISCDSVAMVVRTVVGQSPIQDSIGIAITYKNVDLTDSVKQIFLFDHGVATIKRTNGQQYSCSVDSTMLNVVATGGVKKLYFNLNNCLVAQGTTLQPGDSVIFTGMFFVNPDGPFKDQFTKVPDFRGFGYYINNKDTLVCESYGATFKIAKVRSLFSFPSSSSMPKGCAETDLNYRILTINNDFQKFFGNEFRAAVKVDSVKFYYDPKLINAFDKVEVSVSIPGHPVHGNNFYGIHQLDSTGYFVARFDTLTKVPSYNLIQSYAFNIRLRLVPSCKSLTASSLGNNRFDFDPVIYYTDRYYAKEIGNGSCARVIRDSISNDIVYSEPPLLNITPVTNPNAVPVGDTVTWVVKVCNLSDKGGAAATFAAVSDPTGLVQVLDIKDITNPFNHRTLTVNNYGPGQYFSITDGFKLAVANSTNDDICNTLQIKARVNPCVASTVKFLTGYSCTVFDTANFTPAQHIPCEQKSFDLSVNTSGARLETAFETIMAADLQVCDTVPVELTIRNTDLGSALQVDGTIILPMTGAVMLPGIEVAWPSGQPYVAYPKNFTAGNPNILGVPHHITHLLAGIPYLSVNGLPGFNPVAPNDSNEIKVRFKISTDCQFVSGKVLYQLFGGAGTCGDTLGGVFGNSQPLFLEGTQVPNFSLNVSVLTGSVVSAGGGGKANFQVTNNGQTPTGTTDMLQLIIPDSVSYQFNSAAWSTGLPAGNPVISPLPGGYLSYQWPIPAGLAPGQSLVLGIGLISQTLNCTDDKVPVLYSTTRVTQALCQATNTNCAVTVLTSQGGEQIAYLPVTESGFSLLQQNGTSTCQSDGSESVTYTLQLRAQKQLSAGTYQWQIIDDVNQNGTWDVGEAVLMTQNGTQNWSANQIQSVTFNFLAAPNQICRLALMVNTQSVCPATLLSLHTPRLINAGSDENFCKSNHTITKVLGQPGCGSAYNYQWSALPPAQQGWLSNTQTAQPTLTINGGLPVSGVFPFIVNTSRGGCAATADTVLVTVNHAVVIQPMPDITILPGSNTMLMPVIIQGQGPYSYSWNPSATLSAADVATPIAQPVVNTIYTVTVSDINNCSGTATVLVKVEGEITATAGPNSTICVGQTVQLVAGGGTHYVWGAAPNNPAGGSLNNPQIPNPTFTAALPGFYTYTVTVTDAIMPGITATAQVTITVQPKLDITVTGPPIASCGDSILLTASGAFMYLWFSLDDNTLFQAGVQPTFSTAAPINLYIVGSKQGYCHDTTYYTIEGVTDLEPPVFAQVPSDLYLDCGSPIPSVIHPTVTDNCDDNPLVTFTESPLNGSGCSYHIVRKWTAIDASGNSAVLSQTIYFNDNEPPYLTYTDPALVGLEDGDTLIFSCFNPPIITAGDAVAVDNCDGNVHIVFEDIWQQPGTCEENGYVLFMYCGWTATDACGNSTQISFYVKIVDDVAPVITSAPGDLNLAVGQPVPPPNPALVTVTDNCSQVTVTVHDTQEYVECFLNTYRTYTATDACGNTAQHIQVIKSSGDNTPPTITPTHPFLIGVNHMDTIVLSCETPLPTMGLGDVIVSVDCNDYPTVVFNETFTDTVCSETGYLRLMRCTWHATDGFGNSSMFRFFVKIVDNVPPVFNNIPPNLYISNLSAVPPMNVTATDNCDLELHYLFSEEVLSSDGCVSHVKRQWVVTDHCGNAAVTTQNIYVMPSLAGLNWNGSSNGDTLVFNCGEALPTPTANDLNWALTCLQNPTVTLQTQTLTGLNCVNKFKSIIKYTWTATDAQNNTFEFVIYVAVKDAVAPQFAPIEENIVINTLAEYPAVPQIVVTDACDGSVSVNFFESQDSLTCGGTKYRVWTAVDGCGNVSVLTQSIKLSCNCALDFFEHDAFLLVQYDCNEPGYYCAPVYPENLNKYTFLDNGQPYQGNQYHCADKLLVEYDLDLLPGGGETGPYVITNWQVSGNNLTGTFNNIPTMLTLLNELDPLGIWELWPGTLTVCGDAENGQNYGPMTVVHLPTGTVTTLQPFQEYMPLGVEFEFSTGTHYFEVIDNATGCRDTLYLKVLCLQLPVVQVQTYVTLGGYDSYCLDQLGLGVIESVEEACPNLQSGNVHYEFDSQYNCYYYDGLALGTDTLCLQVCLDNGLCALVYLQTTVVPPTNTGLQNLVVYEGQAGSIQLLADELAQAPVSVKCIKDPDAHVFIINPDHSQGIFYEAQAPGQTSAKFVLRDPTGISDTVQLNITVLSKLVAAIVPKAEPDFVTTTANQEIKIPVLDNDSLYNTNVIHNFIVQQPTYGQVVWPSHLQPVTYTPQRDFCNDTLQDQLVYMICNANGCDTAVVHVRVLCKALSFFNAVSPNGDGLNDVFYIEGLQLYPNNQLSIFNRWGVKVFQAAPYTNNWTATWEGATLPEGTYFFHLDDGQGGTHTGFIQVQR